MAKVIIVGAGIAGLACGWRLQALGCDVELLESESVPGGRMRSERHGDRIVEMVAENVARTPIGRLQPVDSVVHRWDPMLPQFHAGYVRALAAFLQRRERSPGWPLPATIWSDRTPKRL